MSPLLIDGAMNGEIFRAYIEQFVGRWSHAALSAEIFTRPQPDRIALQQRKLAARTVPSLHRAIRSFLHILKPR